MGRIRQASHLFQRTSLVSDIQENEGATRQHNVTALGNRKTDKLNTMPKAIIDRTKQLKSFAKDPEVWELDYSLKANKL